jgi:hypothetical protein
MAAVRNGLGKILRRAAAGLLRTLRDGGSAEHADLRGPEGRASTAPQVFTSANIHECRCLSEIAQPWVAAALPYSGKPAA